MSLAEELIADLEDEEDDEFMKDVEPLENEASIDPSNSQSVFKVPLVPSRTSNAANTLEDIVKVYKSSKFTSIMKRIDQFSSDADHKSGDTSLKVLGPTESDPEYMLIVESNDIIVQLDDEISNIHKYAKDKYTKRFPELETLVVQPIEYLMTAKELGNDVLKAKNNAVLEQYLTQATIMVVSVTASTTQGTPLSDEELAEIREACDLVQLVRESRERILTFVESRMTLIAPNLSHIVGTHIAAQLCGAAGGLTALCKMPSSHLCLLGQSKTSHTGGFTARNISSSIPHTGYIYHSQIVQELPTDVRRKGARIVGDKCMLAARVDLQRVARDASVGKEYKAQIEKRIDKFLEAPPVKSLKSLSIPLEAPKQRRGGRRVRRQKERYAVTELRRQANRMNFAEIEEDVMQTDLGFSKGTVGKGGVGGGASIRAAQIDERTKVRISQTLKKNLQKQQATWGGATSVRKHVSGTASSVAFTPLQGLEIVNPNAAESTDKSSEHQKYFSSSASFMKVKTPKPV